MSGHSGFHTGDSSAPPVPHEPNSHHALKCLQTKNGVKGGGMGAQGSTVSRNYAHGEKAKTLSVSGAPLCPSCPLPSPEADQASHFAVWVIYASETQKALKNSALALARLRSQGINLTVHSENIICASGPASWFTEKNLEALETRTRVLAEALLERKRSRSETGIPERGRG